MSIGTVTVGRIEIGDGSYIDMDEGIVCLVDNRSRLRIWIDTLFIKAASLLGVRLY